MKVYNIELNEDLFMLECINSITYENPLFSKSNLEYQKYYREDITESTNISFAIRNSKNKLLYLFVGYKHLTEKSLEFSNYGLPIVTFEFKPTPIEKKIIINEILKRLDFDSVIIYNQNKIKHLDVFSSILSKKYKSPFLSIISSVNLLQDYNMIKQSYRKSYKSLINKFSKSINTEVYNSDNINKNIYKSFKDLHFKESGRITRSLSTWEQHYKMILSNDAVLICAEHDKIIIGASLFINSKNSVYYGVSASDKGFKQNKPITHLIIDRAILFYKECGYSRLILGPYEPFSTDEKLRGISSFKSAFSNEKIIKINF
tara:strand:+ start:14221 stop:15171 length:951 start_codon:yes stop_codon:yes gene_type:complete